MTSKQAAFMRYILAHPPSALEIGALKATADTT